MAVVVFSLALIMVLLIRSGDVETNPGPHDGNITDVELLNLSKSIPPSSYHAVGIHLEFKYSELESILAACLPNTQNALLRLFNMWINKQGGNVNKRELLSQKLSDADLTGLGNRLLQGELSSSSSSTEVSTTPLTDVHRTDIPESIAGINLKTVIDTLKARYQNGVCQVQRRPWDPQDFTEVKNIFTDETIQRIDRSTGDQHKTTLENPVNDLFSFEIDGAHPKRMILMAPGGYGKTTTVAKLAYDWVHGVDGSPMNDIPVLFILKLRSVPKEMGLGDAIISQLLTDLPGLTAQSIENFIRLHGKHCAVICDGLDEYGGDVTVSDSQNTLIRALQNITMMNCRVLLTTRPGSEWNFLQGDVAKAYVRMEIQGFTPHGVHQYIDRYFRARSKSNDAHNLHTYIKENGFIGDLTKVPLFCVVICHLHEDDLLRGITNLTTFFLKLHRFLFYHSKKRGDIIDDTQLDNVFMKLGEAALKGLKEKKLIFNEEEFYHMRHEYEIGIKLGILSSTTISLKDPDYNQSERTTVEFFHKLEQEYLASVYLISPEAMKSNPSALQAFLNSMTGPRKSEENRNVLRLVAGSSTDTCLAIYNHLSREWRGQRTAKIHMILECVMEIKENFMTQQLVINALQECFMDKGLYLHGINQRMLTGLEKLCPIIRSQISRVYVRYSHLSASSFSRLWSFLRSLDRIDELNLLSTKLELPAPLPSSIPSIRRLQIKRVPLDQMRHVSESVSGVEEMVVTEGFASHEDILSAITLMMDRQRETLRMIVVTGSISSSSVSSEVVEEFGRVVRDRTTRLKKLRLYLINMEETDMEEFIVKCQSAHRLDEIRVVPLWIFIRLIVNSWIASVIDGD